MAVPHKYKLEDLLDRLEGLVQRLEAASEKQGQWEETAVKAAERLIERRSHELRTSAGLGPLDE